MEELNSLDLPGNKSEGALVRLAQKTGAYLQQDTLSPADRRAAEQIARRLAEDAVERVRCALSKAVRHSKLLPRNLAMMLAHDINSVSCPFLEVTEVFSESDWNSLILTVARSARVAIARRPSMTEAIAVPLAELGDVEVVETLLENPMTPMNGCVGHVVLDRFASEKVILDGLARREDLITDIVVRLTKLVSAHAREKLAAHYDIRDFTGALVTEVEIAATLTAVENVSAENLIPVVKNLFLKEDLTPLLILTALREHKRGFLVAALSVLARRDLDHIRRVLNRARPDAVKDLLKRARIPKPMHSDFWKEIENVRHRTNF